MNEIFDNFKEIFHNCTNKIVNSFHKQSKKIVKFVVVVGSLVTLIIIISYIIIGIRLKNCDDVYSQIAEKLHSYMLENKLYPNIEGENVYVELADLSKITFKKKVCNGKVKVTKYGDEYITTYYLNNCSYCSTKEFGVETDKYDNKKNNIEVVTYYNYYEVTINNSNWSKWIPFEEIGNKVTDGVKLPLDEKTLPTISDEAIVMEIVKEDKNFYKYRDKKWKWYKNQNSNYSGLSSEQPEGYANKDTSTSVSTEYTEWNLNYPDTKDYRTIQTQVAYRWYINDENGNKIWWNSGEYYPSVPEVGYKKDTSKTVKMYRYSDEMWKWYNGEKRQYSSSYSAKSPSNSFIYKDEDLTTYDNWSSFKESTTLTPNNSGYREEIINVHSKYLIKYKMRTFLKLEKYLPKLEFEKIMNKTVPELFLDDSVDVDVIFKFRY